MTGLLPWFAFPGLLPRSLLLAACPPLRPTRLQALPRLIYLLPGLVLVLWAELERLTGYPIFSFLRFAFGARKNDTLPRLAWRVLYRSAGFFFSPVCFPGLLSPVCFLVLSY